MIDATDVEIVLFRAYPAVQKSIVKNNTLLSAGNPAYGGITLDPLQSTNTPDYSGSTVDGPGVRVVAWTAGCLFHCLYCHNPDTWNTRNGMPVTINNDLAPKPQVNPTPVDS